MAWKPLKPGAAKQDQGEEPDAAPRERRWFRLQWRHCLLAIGLVLGLWVLVGLLAWFTRGLQKLNSATNSTGVADALNSTGVADALVFVMPLAIMLAVATSLLRGALEK